MGIRDIRRRYKVPAKRGMRVFDAFKSEHGTITSARGDTIRIRLDGVNFSRPYHPTWMIDYLDSNGGVLMSCREDA